MIIAKDARVLTMLGNHPDIKPYLIRDTEFGPDALLNYEPLFEPKHVDRVRFYHNDEESIGMLFIWSSPNVWEMHMLALPEARGGMALEFATAAGTDMYNNQGAKELWGQTAVWNERARKMHLKVGGISRGFDINPLVGKVELFATSKSEWRLN